MKKFLVALSIFALPLFGIGCDFDDEPDNFGEAVEEAGDDMGDAAEEAGDDMKDAFEDVNE